MGQILVTAFEPFGGRLRNASAEVLRLLPEKIGGFTVWKLMLPVAFGRAAEAVLGQQAEAVFLLGEAGGRKTVTPELKARNLRDARIPDNEGNQPRGEKILPEGPAEYHTSVSVRRIAERMRAEGLNVTASEDAGAFVCNDTFYLVGTGSRVPVDFIHCPAEPDRAEELAETVKRFLELALSDISRRREDTGL